MSRAPDASSDTSTPRQIVNCRAFLTARGWQEHLVLRDVDRSAYRDGVVREGFERLLSEVTTETFDVIVVWKLDRLTRRARDFERLWALCEQHRVALVSVTEPVDTTSPVGLAIVRMLLTFAGLESTVKGERIAARAKETAHLGRPPGGGRRAFGHTKDMAGVVEAEAGLLREAAQRVIDGEGLVRVARDWQAREIVGGHGVPWTHAGLRSTLLSPRLVGDRSYRGDVVARDCFAPILDRRSHTLVGDLLARTPKRHRTTRSLLQGVMRCGMCDGFLVSSVSSKGRHIYKCPSPPQGCGRISVVAPPTEELVVAAVRTRLSSTPRRGDGPVPDVGLLPTLRELNRSYFVERALSRAEWYASRADLVAGSHTAAVHWRLHPDIPTDRSPSELARCWTHLTRSAQRALISSVVFGVTVNRRGHSTAGQFDPARLALTWRQPRPAVRRVHSTTVSGTAEEGPWDS